MDETCLANTWSPGVLGRSQCRHVKVAPSIFIFLLKAHVISGKPTILAHEEAPAYGRSPRQMRAVGARLEHDR